MKGTIDMKRRSSAEKTAALIDFALRMVEHEACLLCKRKKAPWQGIFLPDNSIKFGGIPGKDRVLCYRLCTRCKRLPDRMDRVERYMEQQFAHVWN